MSDYTPTTDWIRSAYEDYRVCPPSGSGPGCTYQQAAAEFDHWLADHDHEVAAQTLEEAAQLRRGADAYGVESVPAQWLTELAAKYRVADQNGGE